MHDRLEATRGRIPPGRLVELKYEDLASDPVAAFVEQYAKRSQGYRQNQFASLTAEQIAAVREQGRPFFERYGYREEPGLHAPGGGRGL